MNKNVTDTVTDSLLHWIYNSYRYRWARQCPFPLPLRTAQKLPIRNSWEIINFPWTGKSCFSNRASVKAIFEASKCL